MIVSIPQAAETFSDRMSDIQWDREVIRAIPLSLRLDEASLYQTKWWDYRPIHPAKATTLFAHSYGEAWRRASERRNGIGECNWRVINDPFRTPDWNPFMEAPARAKAFWMARRYCDEAGIPYDFYCNGFFDKAENYFVDLPRPQEMYRRDVIFEVLKDWEYAGGTCLPKHVDFFLRYNWDNKQHQKDWEASSTLRLQKMQPEVVAWQLANNGKYFRIETIKELQR